MDFDDPFGDKGAGKNSWSRKGGTSTRRREFDPYDMLYDQLREHIRRTAQTPLELQVKNGFQLDRITDELVSLTPTLLALHMSNNKVWKVVGLYS